MTVGLLLLVTSDDSIRNLISFDPQIFFNLLLPPIILASGYELHQANFFRYIGPILTFAFAGTFLSAVVIGLILWLYALTGIESLKMNFVDAISVGATLSATDPVTILAIFNTYKVDPKLYTIIFGESILNDAIAIVIFETAQRYKVDAAKLSFLSFFEGFGIFLIVFFGSQLIGVLVGVATALLLKLTYIRRYPKTESCLIVLISYATYFFSNGTHMSGELKSPPTLATPKLTTPRNRLAALLRHHVETLRLLQYVAPDAADHKVHLPDPRAAVGELHLHLPRPCSLHRQCAAIPAAAHHRHRPRRLRRTLGCRVPPLQGHQRCHPVPSTPPWRRRQ
jgi:hypothetical protein